MIASSRKPPLRIVARREVLADPPRLVAFDAVPEDLEPTVEMPVPVGYRACDLWEDETDCGDARRRGAR
jgi:hypothetical protein